jgi:hypothetical protein
MSFKRSCDRQETKKYANSSFSATKGECVKVSFAFSQRPGQVTPKKKVQLGKMEDGVQIVRGPGGIEVIVSFLPNNEILVRVPPPFVVCSETFEVLPAPSCCLS